MGFYSLGPSGNIANLIMGIQQLVTALAIVEISPAGLEATTYEAYTMVANGATTFAVTASNMFIPVFDINAITYATYHNADEAQRNEYNWDMTQATLTAAGICFGAILLFIKFQPKNKEQTREWNETCSFPWKTPFIGTASIVLALATFVFGVTMAFLQMIPATACLKIAGGDGCDNTSTMMTSLVALASKVAETRGVLTA